MKKYNSPLEKRKQLENNFNNYISGAHIGAGMYAGSLLQLIYNTYQNQNEKPFPLIGVVGFIGVMASATLASYTISKLNKLKKLEKENLENKIKNLSKTELNQLKQILSNKELLNLAVEIRDNSLEGMLLEQERIVNDSSNNHEYTELNEKDYSK